MQCLRSMKLMFEDLNPQAVKAVEAKVDRFLHEANHGRTFFDKKGRMFTSVPRIYVETADRSWTLFHDRVKLGVLVHEVETVDIIAEA